MVCVPTILFYATIYRKSLFIFSEIPNIQPIRFSNWFNFTWHMSTDYKVQVLFVYTNERRKKMNNFYSSTISFTFAQLSNNLILLSYDQNHFIFIWILLYAFQFFLTNFEISLWFMCYNVLHYLYKFIYHITTLVEKMYYY